MQSSSSASAPLRTSDNETGPALATRKEAAEQYSLEYTSWCVRKGYRLDDPKAVGKFHEKRRGRELLKAIAQTRPHAMGWGRTGTAPLMKAAECHELLLDRRNRRLQLLNLCGQHL